MKKPTRRDLDRYEHGLWLAKKFRQEFSEWLKEWRACPENERGPEWFANDGRDCRTMRLLAA